MSKYDILIGIDVGKNGGIAITTGKILLTTYKTPDTIQGHFDLMEVILMGLEGKTVKVVVEKVTGRHGDSAHSAFAFGFNTCKIHCALTVAGLSFELAHPKTWMKVIGMARIKGEDNTKWKNRLKDRAKQLYPSYAKDVTLWNADAILIAEYAYKKYNG